MKTTVTITDITRMAPPFVCLAGVREDKQNIRILFVDSRIDEDWLCHNGVTTVRPFARVGFPLLAPRPAPPHTEDWYVDRAHIEDHGQVNPAEKAGWLSALCEPSVAAIFGAEILRDPGFYVLKGQGSRSLGTVLVAQLHDASYQYYEKNWDCRLRFQDCSGETYTLKVKDLSLCAYLDHLREREHMSCEQIGKRLLHLLGTRPCCLRVGLARGWARFPERCYLQITGVFTSPDYLNGRWFADFAVPHAYHPAGFQVSSSSPGRQQVKEMPAPEEEYETTSIPPDSDTTPY